ncbi:MAG TPA: hypothetical protein VG406_13620 [Isosphaeraceae bacterium]|jgi:hypothetical protein|nr:hypothetical protein [Isosphaeraceae bacterium]
MSDYLSIPWTGYTLGHNFAAVLASFLFGVAYERKLIAIGQNSAQKCKRAGHIPEDATGPAARAR